MRPIVWKCLNRLRRYVKKASPYCFSPEDLKWDAKRIATLPVPELLSISKDDNWHLFDINGFRFFWPIRHGETDLPWLHHEIFTPAEYNPHAYEFGDIRIPSGQWVIDAGACEGFFTAYALARGANVLAVEPVQSLCDALARTFEQEIRQGRVKILHGCLGKESTWTKIHINPKSVCMTSMGDDEGETVPVHTIDSIIAQGIIPQVGFIKMDVEGAELDSLQGGAETLKSSKPRLSIAVYHELHNAIEAREIVLRARSDYFVHFRGFYDWEQCIPRPYMLLAL